MLAPDDDNDTVGAGPRMVQAGNATRQTHQDRDAQSVSICRGVEVASLHVVGVQKPLGSRELREGDVRHVVHLHARQPDIRQPRMHVGVEQDVRRLDVLSKPHPSVSIGATRHAGARGRLTRCRITGLCTTSSGV
eukprot:562295-Rhodomonas_salina.5